MTDTTSTPDRDRRPLAFDHAESGHATRTRIGAAVLVRGALGVGSVLARALPSHRQRALESGWGRLVTRALQVDLRVSGTEHLDPVRPHVVMPLHESFVDIPVLLGLGLPMRFVVRDELLGFPMMGRYLTATAQIPVPEAPRPSDLRRIRESARGVIAGGESVVVFPQGSVLGVESAFQRGSAWLARALDLPILPIVIAGTHRIWGFPFSTDIHYGRAVEVRVLEPIPASEVTDAALRAIERTMKAWAIGGAAPVRRYVPERDGWWDGYRFEIDPDFPELARAVATHRADVGGDGDGGSGRGQAGGTPDA